MAKFVRCMEGHAFDSEASPVCPVCGAQVWRGGGPDAGPVGGGTTLQVPVSPPRWKRVAAVVAGVIVLVGLAIGAKQFYSIPAPIPVPDPVPVPSSLTPTPAPPLPTPAPTPEPEPVLPAPAPPPFRRRAQHPHPHRPPHRCHCRSAVRRGSMPAGSTG